MSSIPTLEQQICRALRSILEPDASGGDLIESPKLPELLVGLERYLPSVLEGVYPIWKYESLDGLYLSEARKLGPRSAEFAGLCSLMSDQTLTSFQFRLRVAAADDQIEWMECRLGAKGDGLGGMERMPYSEAYIARFVALGKSPTPSEWAYRVTFGESESG